MDPKARRAAREIFVRLVTLGEGRQDRVVASPGASWMPSRWKGSRSTSSWTRSGTIGFSPSIEGLPCEPTVEIAHELLGAWGRLRAWIDDARDDLRQERGLAGRPLSGEARTVTRASSYEAPDWSNSRRGPRSTDLSIGRPERAYLKASVDQRDREREEEERRRAREARIERSVRRLRGLVAVFAAAALVAAALTVVATNQSDKAERKARIAKARELASAAVANLEFDPELSVLLASEAVRTTRSVDGTVLADAEVALHRAVVASRLELEVPGVRREPRLEPHGSLRDRRSCGLGHDRHQGRRDRGEHPLVPRHDADVNDVAFSADGSRLATTGDDGKLKVWDPVLRDGSSRVCRAARVRGHRHIPSAQGHWDLPSAPTRSSPWPGETGRSGSWT